MGHGVSIMLGGERQPSSGCEHFILFILNHDMHAARVAEHGLPHELPEASLEALLIGHDPGP